MASTPNKIILFKKHAIVSDTTALKKAIDLRTKAIIQNLPKKILIKTNNLSLQSFSLNLSTKKIKSTNTTYTTKYISTILKKLNTKNIKIIIKSNIPPTTNLKSSTSIIITTITTLNNHLNLKLSQKKITTLSYHIKKKIQKKKNNPINTTLTTYNNYQKITNNNQRLNLPPLKIIMKYTKLPHNTFSLIEKVQLLKKHYPNLINPIFQAIKTISKKTTPLIQKQKLKNLNKLININHNLLKTLKIGSKKLSKLIYTTKNTKKTLKTKLTKTKEGEYIITLPKITKKNTLLIALKQAKKITFTAIISCKNIQLKVT